MQTSLGAAHARGHHIRRPASGAGPDRGGLSGTGLTLAGCPSLTTVGRRTIIWSTSSGRREALGGRCGRGEYAAGDAPPYVFVLSPVRSAASARDSNSRRCFWFMVTSQPPKPEHLVSAITRFLRSPLRDRRRQRHGPRHPTRRLRCGPGPPSMTCSVADAGADQVSPPTPRKRSNGRLSLPPRLRQLHQLHRLITARGRRPLTATTPSIVERHHI